jgi:hypothetical protein
MIFYSACTYRETASQNVSNNAEPNISVNNNKDAREQNTSDKTPEEIRLLSSPETVTVALTRNKLNKIEAVSQDEVFSKGDGVRVKVSTAEEGFLYIFYKGSSGGAQVLFPSKQYNGGKNDVKANQVITVPNNGWFFFDEKPGVETVYIIYSKTRDDLLGTNKSGVKLTTQNKPAEIIEYLDEAHAGSREDAYATSNGNLVRRILLNHK